MKTNYVKLCSLALVACLFLMLNSCEKDELNTSTDSEILSKKGKPDKINVCHYSADDDQWVLITVKESSWADHALHGDVRLDDQDGDGFVPYNECGFGNMGDCDDTNSAVNPGMEEICNGIDDNCDGTVDEGCDDAVAIGDVREGGVVFYIAPTPTDLDGDGVLDKGLVCALEDYSTSVQWGCIGTDLPSVPNVISLPPAGPGAEIGAGMTNTNGILTDCPAAPAALAARSLGPEWFLPSAKELNEMYVNKATLQAVSGFVPFGSSYWSSTENNNFNAWNQNFLFGNQNLNTKLFSFDVRAVRAF